MIIGIGVKPNIDLSIRSGIKCDNGIIVDEYGQTSDENILAAGDCTNHPNNILQTRLRLESVHNAVEQGKTVANTISGNKNAYNQIPWFWSEQYNLKIQIAGIHNHFDEYVIDGCIEEERFAIYYLLKKEVVAVEAINYTKSFLRGKKLITSRSKINSAELI